MIFAFIILGIIGIIFTFYYIKTEWSIIIGFLSIFVFTISTIVSFVNPNTYIKNEVEWFNIYDGKHAIYIESDLGDFKLTELSHRNIIKAKKIYVITPVNSWGIQMKSFQEIKYEN